MSGATVLEKKPVHDVRVFTEAAQIAFARLSHDFNPKHVDRDAARRMFFGRQVVHGMHLVLWALDMLTARLSEAGGDGPIYLTALNCLFLDACSPGDSVTMTGDLTDGRARLTISNGDGRAARLTLSFGSEPHSMRSPGPNPDAPICRFLAPEDIEARTGDIPLGFDRPMLAALFPNLAACFDPVQIATILACTRLVGMECPGLNSIFTGLTLTFHDDPSIAEGLRYEVTYWNPDLRLARMSVQAPGIGGTVEAILHPADVRQASLGDVCEHVRPDEFAGEHALIVGGSRGLGETVAKIIGAGGGRTTVTYRDSEQDARLVQRELREAGSDCEVVQFDVSTPREMVIRPATQLYYFATPRIRQDSALGQKSAEEFHAIYVTGFGRTLERFGPTMGPDAVVFYPSSVFVDDADTKFGHYAAAKRAGEEAAREIADRRGVRLLTRRLPRLRTGQTSALIGDEIPDALPVMLEIVRDMTRLRKEQ